MSVPERDALSRPPRQPVFNAIPPVVAGLAGIMIAAAVIGWVAPEAGRWIMASCVVLAGEPGAILPRQPLGHALPYVLHVFVHFGLFHIAMNVAIMVSMGRMVAYALGHDLRGVLGFLALFFACAIVGAATQVLLHTGPVTPMGGASTAVSGLLAAGGWVMGGYRGMLRLALPWVAINIAIAFFDGILPVGIGWAAHIGGTIAGALLFPVVLAIVKRPGAG